MKCLLSSQVSCNTPLLWSIQVFNSDTRSVGKIWLQLWLRSTHPISMKSRPDEVRRQRHRLGCSKSISIFVSLFLCRWKRSWIKNKIGWTKTEPAICLLLFNCSCLIFPSSFLLFYRSFFLFSCLFPPFLPCIINTQFRGKESVKPLHCLEILHETSWKTMASISQHFTCTRYIRMSYLWREIF